MNTIDLSICISTYNFGKFIGQTLDSILTQINDRVEIVIIDGASTDNTQEIVSEYQKSTNSIYYHRCLKKDGIDKAISTSIELAQGRYCWLFSADDVMVQGALDKILDEISSGLDVYLTNFSLYSLDLKTKILERYPITNIQQDSVFDFNDREQRRFYFKNAIETCAFFSFMSSLIINRSKWLNSWCEEQFMGSCWAHVPRIFHMMNQSLKMKYLHTPHLIKRDGNDSFMDKGYIHRIGISIHGFTAIGKLLFSNFFEMKCIKKTLRKEHSFRMFMHRKFNAKKEEIRELKSLLIKSRGRFSPEIFCFILCPPFCWKILQLSYRKIKRIVTLLKSAKKLIK